MTIVLQNWCGGGGGGGGGGWIKKVHKKNGLCKNG